MDAGTPLLPPLALNEAAAVGQRGKLLAPVIIHGTPSCMDKTICRKPPWIAGELPAAPGPGMPLPQGCSAITRVTPPASCVQKGCRPSQSGFPEENPSPQAFPGRDWRCVEQTRGCGVRRAHTRCPASPHSLAQPEAGRDRGDSDSS